MQVLTVGGNLLQILGETLLSCELPIITLAASPPRDDATFLWTTVDGQIIGDPANDTIYVSKPGTYNVSTTLPTNCEVVDAGTTIDFDPLKPFFEPSVFVKTVSCNGNDGSIDLTVVGGTAPYTFNWSNGSTGEDPSGLAAGTYVVTITDAIMCTYIDSVTVAARVPTVISNIQTNNDCNGNSIGTIDISVTGKSPFSYNWSNGAISEDLSNLPAGTYTLTVTDADNCTEIFTTTITEPTPISMSCVKTDETDSALNDGAIDITVSGGTTPYTFDWDNNGADDPDIDPEDLTGLAAGNYTVTVTDTNGCTITDSKTIFEPEICNDGIDNDGDGLSDCTDSDCTPATPGTITPSDLAPCVGDVGITYSIAAVPGITVYSWTVPTGATITSGQGTTTLMLDWTGTQGGQICVQSDNVGCLSPNSCIVVSPEDVPDAPPAILNSN